MQVYDEHGTGHFRRWPGRTSALDRAVQDSMSSKNPCRDSGDDCGIDFEQIARNDKAINIRGTYAQHTEPAVYEFLEALRDGEDEREAYQRMVSRFIELSTVAYDHLEDLGEFDREDPQDYFLARALDTTSCATTGRIDRAEGHVKDLIDSIEEIDEGDNGE